MPDIDPGVSFGGRGLHVSLGENFVATLMIDRPATRNSVDATLMADLPGLLKALGDAEVRALVLTGTGGVFSSGADIAWVATDEARLDAERLSRDFDRMFRALRDFPAPVVARVNGDAFGAAMGLLACSDVVVAVEDARFGFTEARLGLVPAVVATYALPIVGLATARRYFLTGETFAATVAEKMNLVHDVCARPDLDLVVAEVIDELLLCAPVAQREAKTLLRGLEAARDEATAREMAIAANAARRLSVEAREGVRAFRDRSEPSWRS